MTPAEVKAAKQEAENRVRQCAEIELLRGAFERAGEFRVAVTEGSEFTPKSVWLGTADAREIFQLGIAARISDLERELSGTTAVDVEKVVAACRQMDCRTRKKNPA